MLKSFYILIFFLTFISAQTEIKFSKTFIKKIKPEIIAASISFEARNSLQETVIEKLTIISEFMDANKNLKVEGGRYSINPRMIYKDGRTVQDGYEGFMSYNVSSKDPKVLNKLIREIQRLGSSSSVLTTISSVSWQMSEEQQAGQGNSDSLRLDAILWAKSYAKALSVKMGANCGVSNIDFNTNQPIFYDMAAKAAPISKDSAPIPAQDEQNIQITPLFILVCR